MAKNKPNSNDFGFELNLSKSEIKSIRIAAQSHGFNEISDYFRFLHDSSEVGVSDLNLDSSSSKQPPKKVRQFLKTKYGRIFHGDSCRYLFDSAKSSSVDLILTSPPFGLVRKKKYGNEDAENYCDWFRPFAKEFNRVLKDSGSLVIDIGGAWIPGQPTRSLYHFKLLIMLVEEYGFHLCQEHYWWNPAKLPSPAEWVNVRRIRVKDAVNTVWWLAKTPYPKANNKRVLQPYSNSMKSMIKNGYTPKLRPSGHDISKNFNRNNGGSVPPNLLAIANTESSGQYQDRCRAKNVVIHPARFPSQIPEYFIRFLTNKGDLVVDPFGGSCVTGMVAENLCRKWICCEINDEYLQGAKIRFVPKIQSLPKNKNFPYTIFSPCTQNINEERVPLSADGGLTRPIKKQKTTKKLEL